MRNPFDDSDAVVLLMNAWQLSPCETTMHAILYLLTVHNGFRYLDRK